MPPPPVRAKLHLGIVIFASLASFCLVGGLTLGGLALVFYAPYPGNLIGAILALAGLIISYFVLGTNRFIELDNDIICEKRLFTGQRIEHRLEDLVAIVPLISLVGGASGLAMDALLGTTNRGFLLRFESGKKLGLIRGDFVGVDDFMLALKDRLGPRWAELGKSK